VLLTELDLTNESRSMITSDRPPHLTSPRRGEGFFAYLRREKSQGWEGLQCEDRSSCDNVWLCDCPAQIYKPSQRAYQETVKPYEYGSEHRVYKINNWGYVRFAHHQTYISQTFKDTYVQLIPHESEDSVMDCYRNFVIVKIDVTNGELMSRKAFRLKSLYN
jgi:hypothetical protein